ncbi:MAG: glycosyltransferase family 39 protein [Burkholderiales bacterium]
MPKRCARAARNAKGRALPHRIFGFVADPKHLGGIALFLAALLTLFRLWLAAAFPITGDEAYFAIWGLIPAWGYYDHPPMVGWWLALLTHFSSATWVLRLPSLLVPLLLAWGIYLSLRNTDREKALLAALAFSLLPLSVWNVFITTDTPLVLFCFLAGVAWWKAMPARDVRWSSTTAHKTRWGGTTAHKTRWQVLAGVFLGLAFLSKYFSALLVLVFIADVLLSPRGERDWRGLGIAFLCALPFGLFNLWWNYEHCWANLMFNLYNRHDSAGLSWKSPLLFIVVVAYVLSPLALWQWLRGRSLLAQQWREPGARFLLIACALPFLLFALLSLVRPVGLHWVLAFLPFFFMAAAVTLGANQLRATVFYLGGFSVVHIVAIMIVASLPLETWKNTRWYDGIVFHFRINQVVDSLKTFQPEFELAADGYSGATTASVVSGNYVFVFGTASSHARHDDLVTDFRRYEGKNILVFRKNPPSDHQYLPYFDSVEYGNMKIAGATFHLVFGRGFRYEAYKTGVLAPMRDSYYRIPRFLPQGGCEFCGRYFETSCPVR